jgi:hypothetical protein
MRHRWQFKTATILAPILACTFVTRAQQPNSANPLQKFQQDLTALAPASADDCGWDEPHHSGFTGDTARLEDSLMEDADAAIVQALNAPSAVAKDAVAHTLAALQATSDRVNDTWPANRRFHADLLAIDPAFVVTYHVRSRSTWSVFAVADEALESGKGANTKWAQVGEDEFRWQEHNSGEEMAVYPLDRGPSKRARFLAKSSHVSCGDGITSIAWDAYEWDPASMGRLTAIIDVQGAGNRGDYPQYAPIGKLQTRGPRITLPSCWWSALDMTPDAILCSVDTYDISHDQVRFIGRQTNRPDLETVAKVVKFAQDRDERALLAYTASPAVARKLVEQMPAGLVANLNGDPYPPLHGITQTIDLTNDSVLRFVLEKRNERWVVTQFLIDP